MTQYLANDSDPVPGPPLPGISAARLALIRRWSTVLIIAAVLLAAAWFLAGLYADFLWFDQLGYGLIFLYLTLIERSLFIIGGLLAATLLALNISVALPLAMGPISRPLPIDFLRLVLAVLRLMIYASLVVTGLVFGSLADNHWPSVVLLFNRLPFGVVDPHFGLDATFYVVDLVVLRALQGWLLALLITLTAISAAFYAAIYALRGLALVLTPRTLRHLAALGIAIMLTLAFHHVLSIYELVLSEGGGSVVAGASYTDVHARIPVYWFLAAIALLAAAIMAFAALKIPPSPSGRGAGGEGVPPGPGTDDSPAVPRPRRDDPGALRLVTAAFSLWLVMFLLAGVLYPALFQRFRVNPDEFAREQPFIQRNIDATRAAFGLDSVQESLYPVSDSLTAPAPAPALAPALAFGERPPGLLPAMAGIRLWDAAPLLAAYNQLQFMELYYTFLNMDSDRYLVDGRLRQVLVGARELDPQNLPDDARNWVNQRLQYTHGYGLSMTPATGFTPGEGRPQYFIQGIPIHGDLPVRRPEIYYGESPIEFAIVNTAMPEVTPSTLILSPSKDSNPVVPAQAGTSQRPTTSPNPNPPLILSPSKDPLPQGQGPGVGSADSAAWHYDGDGGVPLNSWFRRALYALRFADVNIALSDQVTPQSRIQFNRHVRHRLRAVAPFLQLDQDPYPVLDTAGKLWWIQDAYTATASYPYSTRFSPLPPGEGPPVRTPGAPGFNYIRNSVKAVVDAYNGDVTLYVMDPADPLLRMYRDAFPVLFRPFAQMPADLQSHIRYPVALFSAQAHTYLRYHVTDPRVFFNQAEQWDIPLETRLGKDGVRVTPTYVLMPLPPANNSLPSPPGRGAGGEGVSPSPEFVLLMPFSPAGQKKNLVGLLVARNDPPNYGQLLAYHLPDDRQIDGPSQVEARIENDQDFSQLFTLWDGSGSKIIRGRLLPIPIAGTIVYVEPLYLQSQFLEFPELKKVILADNTNLVMADSMAEAVARLSGQHIGQDIGQDVGQDVGDDSLPSPPGRGAGGEGVPPGAGPDSLQQLDEIEATIEELQQALQDLQGSLQNLRNTLGGNSP